MTTFDELFPRLRSRVPGVVWPPMLAPNGAILAAMMQVLERTQWMPAAMLRERQFAQLGVLASHCAAQSPQFARRLAAAGLTAAQLASADGLARLPVLTRRELQSAADLFCSQLPAGHGPASTNSTSGSTGEPVVVRRTAMNQLDWLALSLRDHLWHSSNFELPLLAVRANLTARVQRGDWGPPASLLFATGPFLGLPVAVDAATLFAELQAFQAGSVIGYPSILAALVDYAGVIGASLPQLRVVRTVGETLSDSTRAEAERMFGCKVHDNYSSQEMGVLALQCPSSGQYHCMDEYVLVEVLRADGAPCVPGETGRVVVTDLHNFATPLIRYEIGDHAQVGEPCACGRGLSTLQRVLGRERNLILMPDGRRHWPVLGRDRFREFAPIWQFQMLQIGREEIEVRLVVEHDLSPAQTDALTALIHEALGHPFQLRFACYRERLPTAKNGKFEEFVCLV